MNFRSYTRLRWEYIEEMEKGGTVTYLRRAPVIGGWLVETVRYEKTKRSNNIEIGYGVGLTFIPDPEHKWELIEKEYQE